MLEVTDSWAIDAARTNTADGRMINDTVTTNKQPNVKFAFDARRKIVTIRALRAIRAGEELFIDYGREYWARDQQAGGAPQRKQNERQATAAGTKDNPIALDSLARRVFHCKMLTIEDVTDRAEEESRQQQQGGREQTDCADAAGWITITNDPCSRMGSTIRRHYLTRRSREENTPTTRRVNASRLVGAAQIVTV